MTAASYWSLLAPAIEMAEVSGSYGSDGQWAFIPVAVGFALGALFVFGADKMMPHLVCLNSYSLSGKLLPLLQCMLSNLFDNCE